MIVHNSFKMSYRMVYKIGTQRINSAMENIKNLRLIGRISSR